MLVDSCSHKLFAHKIPMHRKWVSQPQISPCLTLLVPHASCLNFAYMESNKISMLVDHALCDGYIVEFINDATENYYEGGTYACRNCNNIKFPLYVLKILKLCMFCLPMLVDSCSHKLFAHKIPIGSGLDLNVLVICFMMLSLYFNFYLLCEHH